ncbi:MAG TPA: thioredoxin family protein [Verrucomicrobiae bacterium]|jgi:thioredoxin 1|nr:thioredoxin family protein [Verrucomicrobiae bacterium]
MTSATSENFGQEVLLSSGPVLVDFYTPDCGPCRAMAPLLDEISRERGDALKIVKVDAGENPQLAAQFRVTAMPTFILFQDGAPQRQIIGARSKKLFTAWIDGRN